MSDILTVPPRLDRAPAALNRPVLALVLYEGEHTFACKHRVFERAGKPVLGAAQGLSEADARALLVGLGGRGLTPTCANTLATSPTSVAWWVPPGERALLFDPKDQGTRGVARLSGVPVPWPGLVMTASPQGLHVFAVKGRDRPEPQAALYNAPFWNLFSSGLTCRGSVRYPGSCTPEDQAAWETVFFQSVFTGPSRTDRYLNWGQSYEELLDGAVLQGAFPEAVLTPSGSTLGGMLAREAARDVQPRPRA
jgi:PRTRC genetic system protein B